LNDRDMVDNTNVQAAGVGVGATDDLFSHAQAAPSAKLAMTAQAAFRDISASIPRRSNFVARSAMFLSTIYAVVGGGAAATRRQLPTPRQLSMHGFTCPRRPGMGPRRRISILNRWGGAGRPQTRGVRSPTALGNSDRDQDRDHANSLSVGRGSF